MEIITGVLMVLYMMHVAATWKDEPSIYKNYKSKHPGEENENR